MALPLWRPALGLARASRAAGGLRCRPLAAQQCRPFAASARKSLVSRVLDGSFGPESLSKESGVLSKSEADSVNRWALFPKVFLIQVPTGAVYAWSMWAGPLTKTLGVVGTSSLDWGIGAVSMTFSSLAVGFGVSVGALGPWIEKAGPRKASLVGAALFGGGHILSAFGCITHQIPLIWLGWGVMGGLGWGLGYISPISLLVKWWPDRKGMATGLCISAFAGGGLVAAPLIEYLRTRLFFRAPTFAGALGSVEQKTEAGRSLVLHDGQWCEALLAGSKDIAALGLPPDAASRLAEGFYLVGTGDNGCAMTFATLGLGYMASMATGSQLIREPPPGWTPPGFAAAAAGPAAAAKPPSSVVADGSVAASTAMRLPQFYLLWLTLGANASAGVAVISAAKMMMSDIFATTSSALVTTAFTTGFVSALSLANAGGRLGWAAVSDYIGRKNTMFITSLSLPACLLIPQITQLASSGAHGELPVYLFYGTTFCIVTWYGGVLALVPSYAADVFGPKEVGVIYGRLMTSWSVSAIITPGALASLRGAEVRKAINGLVEKIDGEKFEQAFGAPVSDLDKLVEAKTVTITRLLELAPPGTVDPSLFLYDSSFYAVSGVLATAAVSNALISKVDAKHLIPAEAASEVKSEKAQPTDGVGDGGEERGEKPR